MAIYAISDLHLSFNKFVSNSRIDPQKDIYKPMDIFGWNNYITTVREQWMALVSEEDTVLIPGDTSWAVHLDKVIYDFDWISQLPGSKILSPGNHCYFAKSKKKIANILPDRMYWLDGDAMETEDVVIAATRGWNLPGDRNFQEQDYKIYERQVGRLRMALDKARQINNHKKIVVMLHFPPITSTCKESGFMQVMQEYEVAKCIYGHLHGDAIRYAIEDNVGGIDLKLVSCDALKFSPIRIV